MKRENLVSPPPLSTPRGLVRRIEGGTNRRSIFWKGSFYFSLCAVRKCLFRSRPPASPSPPLLFAFFLPSLQLTFVAFGDSPPSSSSSSLFSRRVAGIEDMWRWLLFKETIWEMGKKTLFCLRAFPGAKKTTTSMIFWNVT